MKHRFLRVSANVLVFTIFWLSAGRLSAQVDEGTIIGTVTDQSAAAVPGVTMTLTNVGTGLSVTTTTTATGTYVFSPVKVGTYTVTAERPGFQKVTRERVTVDIQQHVVVDLSLPLGAVTQTVSVTATVPLLQSQDASVGEVVGSQQVTDLPLNGRNYTFLAQLLPGTTVSMQDDFRHLNANGTFEANGVPFEQNSYLLDGLDNNSTIMDFLNGTAYVVRPPVDAIQEFKVTMNNYSADLGKSSGAVVNAVIKSGNNQIHGDAWEFVRNSALDANDFFLNAANEGKSEYRRNQFGATIGGPIVIPHVYNGRDKTFFFGDYEGTRIREGVPETYSVPTVTERNSGYTDLSELITDQTGTRTDLLGRVTPLGTVFDPATTRAVTANQVDPVTGLTATGNGFVRDPFPGNQLPASRLDQNAIKILNLYAVPNRPGVVSNYVTSLLWKDTIDQFDTRVDHIFSAKDQMFSAFSWYNQPESEPAPFGVGDGGGFDQQGVATGVGVAAALGETHVFSPTLVNELRLGYNRLAVSWNNADASILGIPAQYGFSGIPQSPGEGGLPPIIIEGLSNLGRSTFYPSIPTSAREQLSDDLTKIHGSHTFKMGFMYLHEKHTYLSPESPSGYFTDDGTYTEVPETGGGNTGLAQLLLTPMPTTVPNGFNNVGGFDEIIATALLTNDFRKNYYGLYAQDDWKATRKLTVNLGVRWEWFQPVYDIFGAQANIIPAPPGSAQYLIPSNRCHEPMSSGFLNALTKDGIALECSSNYSLAIAQKTNFSPRIGFAYQATNKLVLRGGYGIFYSGDAIPGYGGGPWVNYPFGFSFFFYSPDAAHPISFPNGSIATIETGLSGVSLNPVTAPGTGIALDGVEYHQKTPLTEGYNVTAQYAITPHQSISLAFIGNGTRHIESGAGANTVHEVLPPSVNPQLYVPYPDFARGGGVGTFQGNSVYESGQATYERKFAGGLNLLANYTYANCRMDSQDVFWNYPVGGWRAPEVPGFGIQPDYGLCDFSVRQIFHFSGGYVLPVGRGQHFLKNASGVANALLGGWRTNFIFTAQDGFPLNIPCTISTTAGLGCNALLVPGQNPIAGPHDVNQWLNAAAFHNPPVATTVGETDFSVLGGARTAAVGPGFTRLDFSLFKEIKTSERSHLEFRAEFFNLLNSPMFSNPAYTNFTNTATFGEITSTRDAPDDPREIQFALKFYF